MSVIKLHVLFLVTLLTLHNSNAQVATNEAAHFIDHPDKNEYSLKRVGGDKHSFGYELRENKHFHHTTTEDDGVRLGCYGYVLDGKKYSTQYVADVKGYRPVYTYDVINVYPKSGDVRQASFIGNFNEDEKKSSNIRYFFPEGCRGGIELSPDENKMAPPVPIPVKATPAPTRPPPPPPSPPPTPPPTPKIKIAQPPPVDPFRPPVVVQKVTPTPPPPPPPLVASTYLPPVVASSYLPPLTPPTSIPGKYITKTVATTVKKQPPPTPRVTPKPPPPVQQNPPITISTSNCEIYGNCVSQAITITNPADSCNQCCSADSAAAPTVTIPIKLGASGKGACPSFAKLTIPAGSVSAEKLKALLSNSADLERDVLRALS